MVRGTEQHRQHRTTEKSWEKLKTTEKKKRNSKMQKKQQQQQKQFEACKVWLEKDINIKYMVDALFVWRVLSFFA